MCARFIRNGIAWRETAHKAGTAAQFLDFFRNKMFIVEACSNNAALEHQIDVQRNSRKNGSDCHGDKHFQKRKALKLRTFNSQSIFHLQIRTPPSLTDNVPNVLENNVHALQPPTPNAVSQGHASSDPKPTTLKNAPSTSARHLASAHRAENPHN